MRREYSGAALKPGLEKDPFEVDKMAIRDIAVGGTALAGKLQPA